MKLRVVVSSLVVLVTATSAAHSQRQAAREAITTPTAESSRWAPARSGSDSSGRTSRAAGSRS
jgi:hypothetical protein